MRVCHPCPAINSRRRIPWQRSALRHKHRARSCRGERFQRYFCFQYKNYGLLTISFKLPDCSALGGEGRERSSALGPPEHPRTSAGVPLPAGPRCSRPRAARRGERRSRQRLPGGLLHPAGHAERASGGGGSLLHLHAAAFLLRRCWRKKDPLGLVSAQQRSQTRDGPSGRVRAHGYPKSRSGLGGRKTTSDTRGATEGSREARRRGGAGKHRPSQPVGTSHPVPELGSSRLIAPSALRQATGSACCPQPVRGAAAVTNPLTSGTSTISRSAGHVRTERAPVRPWPRTTHRPIPPSAALRCGNRALGWPRRGGKRDLNREK